MNKEQKTDLQDQDRAALIRRIESLEETNASLRAELEILARVHADNEAYGVELMHQRDLALGRVVEVERERDALISRAAHAMGVYEDELAEGFRRLPALEQALAVERSRAERLAKALRGLVAAIARHQLKNEEPLPMTYRQAWNRARKVLAAHDAARDAGKDEK